MRVLDVNNLYSPTGGGVRTYHERRLARYAAGGPISYTLVVPSDRFARRTEGAAQVWEVPAISVGAGYRMIVRASSLRPVLDAVQPDVIEIGSVYVLPRVLRGALAGRSVATVGFYHADYPDTYVGPLTQRFGAAVSERLTRAARAHAGRAYGQMTAVCAASAHVLGKLHSWGVERLYQTPLGVDLDVFSPQRRQAALRASVGMGPDDGRALVLSLGRLAPEKGVDVLCRTYAHWRDPSRFQLVIGGHGPSSARVDALCAQFPEIRRIPYQTERAAVAAWLASADVVLSLGAFETFSLSTIEALGSGTPVVATAAGGAAELVLALGGPAPVPTAGGDAAVGRALQQAICGAVALSATERAALAARVAAQYGWDQALTRIEAVWAQAYAAHRDGDLARLRPPDGRWHAVPS